MIRYEEAGGIYSNATRISAYEAGRLSPVMKRQEGEFTRTLNSAIEEAAEHSWKLDQYRQAM